MQISATIITLNEENNLRRACESLRGVADEIVIVDSGSRDGTVSIARTYTPHCFTNSFESYSKQKNLASEKATYPWILSLDADECLSEELRASILELKSNPERPDVAGFRCARRAWYLGGWIRHSGWYPDYKVRLYDRDRARWAGEFVHESLQVDGRVEMISGDLLHFTVNSIADHISRLNRYTTLAAQQDVAQGKRATVWKCFVAPPLAFLKSYLLKGGMLDGWRGLCIASFACWYVFLKYVKLRELRHPGRQSGSSPS
jgi:glycosyltransferase involved in cell wall biosynthesis